MANVVEFFFIVMLVVKITLHDFRDTDLDVWLVKPSFWALIIDCLLLGTIIFDAMLAPLQDSQPYTIVWGFLFLEHL